MQTPIEYKQSSSSYGIDFPELKVDIKVSSIKQPQSSCPFDTASQKIFGLGYHLLLFIYEKIDANKNRTSKLNIHHVIFIDKKCTADFQTTKGLTDILERGGNKDDISAFIIERNLPVDEIGAEDLAYRILRTPPMQGFLTISNALQWRLQYTRAIQIAGTVPGISRIH